MKPEEIDRKIAERVMGWLPHFRNTAFYVKKEEATKVLGKRTQDVSDWKPSTRIDHAFEVVEKMLESGHTFQLEYYYSIGKSLFAIVDFENNYTHLNAAKSAGTPAMAICLAALEAVKD